MGGINETKSFNLLADIGDIRGILQRLDHHQFNADNWRSILKTFYRVINTIEVSLDKSFADERSYSPLKQISESQSQSDYLLKYQMSELAFSFTGLKYCLYSLDNYVVKQAVEDIIKDIHRHLNQFVDDAKLKSERYRALHPVDEPTSSSTLTKSAFEIRCN